MRLVDSLLPAFHNPDEIAIPQDEHAFSVEASIVFDGLAQLDRRGKGYASEGSMTRRQAAAVSMLIEDVYEAEFPARAYDEDDDSEEDTEHEPISAISSAIVQAWRADYYIPRSREATAGDFQEWLNTYVKRCGRAALDEADWVRASFLDTYRPWRDPQFAQTAGVGDLRVATNDILLMPGFGALGLNIIEPKGLTVARALPEVYDHHRVFDGHAVPSALQRVRIPRDIVVPEP